VSFENGLKTLKAVYMEDAKMKVPQKLMAVSTSIFEATMIRTA